MDACGAEVNGAAIPMLALLFLLSCWSPSISPYSPGYG